MSVLSLFIGPVTGPMSAELTLGRPSANSADLGPVTETIASNANVSESLGLEHCTLVHSRHAFSECIEDHIDKAK